MEGNDDIIALLYASIEWLALIISKKTFPPKRYANDRPRARM